MSEIHFRSHFWPFQIDTQLFKNFLQNGCCRPFWMSEIHFVSHFWPFLDQYRFCNLFTKLLPWPFLMSKNHFRSHFWPFQIDTELLFFLKFLTKWLTSAILDVRNSLSIAFLANLDRSTILDFLFGCLKIALDHISGHFRLIGHFGCPKFTFDGISGHFRAIRNFNYFFKFLTNWPPAAILDVRK